MAETNGSKGPDEAGAGPSLREKIRKSPMGNIAIVGITALVVLAGLWIVNHLTDDGKPSASSSSTGGVTKIDGSGSAPAIGKKAPGFEAVALDGTAVSSEALKGKPVWLVFGATWCSDCRSESPDIQAVQETYGDRVEIVGVYVDEADQTVAGYAKRLGLTFRQVADSGGELGAGYGVMGIPMHVFIDASGKVSAIAVGTLTEKQAEGYLDDLVDKAPGPSTASSMPPASAPAEAAPAKAG